MAEQYPITPPPEELVQEWLGEFFGCTVSGEPSDSELYLTTQAARWGADQELEACCEWLSVPCPSYGRELRAARRPKIPSTKAQALAVLDDLQVIDATHYNILRNALEQLDDN